MTPKERKPYYTIPGFKTTDGKLVEVADKLREDHGLTHEQIYKAGVMALLDKHK